MALFSDEPPPLHVPDGALRRPKGAEVGDDGLVACVSCGNRLPPARMDIVGQGYRCAPCSHQAEITRLQRGGEVDAAAHLSKRERTGLRESAARMIGLGLAMIAGGVLVIVAAGDMVSLGTVLIGGGVASMSVGAARRGAAG